MSIKNVLADVEIMTLCLR